MTDDLAVLARLDPSPADRGPYRDQPLDDRARTELALLREESPVPGRRALAAAVAVAVLALLAVSLVLPRLGGTPALADAAAPRPLALDASGDLPALSELAARARADAGAGGTADEQRLAWQEWSLFTRVHGEQVRSAVVPQEVARTPLGGGSVRVRVVTAEPSFPTAEHREAWQDAGRPGEPGTLVRDEVLPAGASGMFPDAPPSTPEAMSAYLRRSHPVGENGPAELLVAVGDLAREWRLDGAQRAAVLEVLAAESRVTALGSTRDRLGRPGVAYGVESAMSGLPTRYLIVLDPRTGALLSTEQVLTTDAGALDVPVPSVVSYTAWRT